MEAGPLRLDLFHRDAACNGRWLALHPREFALLWRLAETPGRTVSQQDLLADVWRLSFEPGTNRVAVHIARLRRKLATVRLDPLIVTDGAGYRFEPAAARAFALDSVAIMRDHTPIVFNATRQRESATMATQADEKRVETQLDDSGVMHVRLNRPDKMNALDPQMFEAIIAAGEALMDRKDVRVVVLSGAGPSFCAGLDTSSFARTPDPDEPKLTTRIYGDSNTYQQVATVWRKLPMPVIAALHGVCFGGGMQIASGADIRVAAPTTRMAIMEMKWGLVPDMGGYHLWRGLVRDDVLRELVYTNREFTGEEAQALGLATFVADDPLAKAKEIAATIAQRNPDAVRAAKRLSNRMHDQRGEDLLMAESEEQAKIIRQPNQIEAVMAGMAKRAADFSDAS
ncbi:crotonase/enoyl-CoA hydratase family protein [Alteriqipengyuania lutimaris]|uniref:Crotonase/enoyl-CoA hydratase family protein n=2 Tax=Alteriqipengyuania lutimaris TaxID=1538146 RepID=A0A395LHC6_9SPHN|nr:crotonase/enoyl-CoA hydratase family protein [Alteriqipengyuania lutimaris]RDS76316.1 crotonase/enoyl-CoA hydratase family protein [Alteriqipengyuania lutimaris]